MNTIYQPILPHVSKIPFGINPGKKLQIAAIIPTADDELNISIQSGLDPKSDIVLNLSLRPHEHAIIRNTMRNEQWEAEERSGGCPIFPGQEFTLAIMSQSNCFRVYISNIFFCKFEHRFMTPISQAQYLVIEGPKAKVTCISTEHDLTIPLIKDKPFIIKFPTLPYLGIFPENLKAGSEINIVGIIKGPCNTVAINLQNGPNTLPRDDVVLHLSVRPFERVIVRDTMQNSVWQREERELGCPIETRKKFAIKIIVKESFFEIWIDDNKFCNFTHRMPFSLARYISIEGDFAKINCIEMSPVPCTAPPASPKKEVLEDIDLAQAITSLTSEISEGISKCVKSFYDDDKFYDKIETIPAFSPIANPFMAALDPSKNMLKITAKIEKYGDWLQINLQKDKKPEEVIFHVSIRPEQNEIVRNTKRSGKWEMEEKDGPCPVSIGERFEILIKKEAAHFTVYFNRKHLCDFKFRMSSEEAKFVYINGGTLFCITY